MRGETAPRGNDEHLAEKEVQGYKVQEYKSGKWPENGGDEDVDSGEDGWIFVDEGL
jgi:hypothetical protein